MNIIIAPNAYKNSLTATEAADAIKLGLAGNLPDCSCTCFPVGDGGDGTGSLIISRFNGQHIPATVMNPFGQPVAASFGLIEDGPTAVIEMATASGLRLLDAATLNPLHASSSGTGELIQEALNRGVKQLIIGIGGSATVDGGAGILAALGIRFLDNNGAVIPPVPEQLRRLHYIDDSGLDVRIHDCEIIVLCDVENRLLGADGAAAVFGPQKGASPADIVQLEAALSAFRDVTLQQKDLDIAQVLHGGAAGGTAAGLYAWLNAKLVYGIDYYLQLTGFDEALRHCDMVITGEGSVDMQTIQGKAPAGVARKAKAMGIPVVALSGCISLNDVKKLEDFFDVILPIVNAPGPLEEAMRLTSQNLTRTANELGKLLQFKCLSK